MPLMKFLRTGTYTLPSTAEAILPAPLAGVDLETPAWPLSGTGAAEPRVFKLVRTTMQKEDPGK